MQGCEQMITIKEIARLANVSSATVSKVINGKDRYISEETRKRVLEIVEREGYIPNGIAKSLKMKRTKTIGIILPDVMNLFFSEVAKGAEDAAERKGYTVILCNSDNSKAKEGKYINILQEKMVDGIILTASEAETSKYLERCNIPMVLVDRDLELEKPVGRIVVDNVEGTYKATNYLISKGCKSIGFVSSQEVNKLAKERLLGYKKALRENGMEIDPNKIFLKSFTVETGYEGVYHLFNQGHVDGICCGNDLIAIGVIQGLKEKGISVPEEVKIIGFDNICIGKYLDPPLTTVRQPIYKLGEEAVNVLISIIENKDTEMVKVLDTEIVVRASA